jgi:hypothetical protein
VYVGRAVHRNDRPSGLELFAIDALDAGLARLTELRPDADEATPSRWGISPSILSEISLKYA